MIKKLTPWAGMIGTVLFTLVYLVDGWLTTEYSPVKMYVSELSIGPHGWIQMVNFMIFGALLFIFSLGILRMPLTGKAPRAGAIILLVMALCLFFSGPMQTDPSTIFDHQTSIHGMIHGILGALVFSLSPICCFVFWRYFRKEEAWKSIRVLAFIAGVVTAIGIVFMKVAQPQASALNDFSGLIQRINLMTFHAWLFIFSLRIWKSSRSPISRQA